MSEVVATRERRTPDERFERFIVRVPESGCWIWIGGLNSDGYGTFKVNTHRTEVAHRFSYWLHRGSIPPYKELDHTCRVRCCANPFHLEPVTTRENILRGVNPAAKQARQTHCRKGHALIDGNLYRFGRKRYCKKCHNEYNKAKYEAIRRRP